MSTSIFKNRSALSRVVACIIIIAVTVVISVGVAWLMMDTKIPAIPEPSTVLTGYFSGQIIDAATLNPIPNATVYFAGDRDLSFSIATLTTDETGFYKIKNVTLPSDFYLLAKAPGYYLMPPTQMQIPLYANETEGIYTIAAIPLWKVSNNTKLSVDAYLFENGTYAKNVDVYILNGDTLTLNSPRLDLYVNIDSYDFNIAAAGPYAGINYLTTINSNGGPTNNAIVTDDLTPVFLDNTGSATRETQIMFYESGTYTVSINLYDEIYYYTDMQRINYFDHYTFTVKVAL